MENLYLLIEMREGLIGDVIVYDKPSDAKRKFRTHKREIKSGDSSIDTVAFYRIDSQLRVHHVDYFDQEMR